MGDSFNSGIMKRMEGNIVAGLTRCEIEDRIETKKQLYSRVNVFYSNLGLGNIEDAEADLGRLEEFYPKTKGHWKEPARDSLVGVILNCKIDMEDWESGA